MKTMTIAITALVSFGTTGMAAAQQAAPHDHAAHAAEAPAATPAAKPCPMHEGAAAKEKAGTAHAHGSAKGMHHDHHAQGAGHPKAGMDMKDCGEMMHKMQDHAVQTSQP